MEFEESMVSHELSSPASSDYEYDKNDWSKPPPVHKVKFNVQIYQEWEDDNKLQFLTRFHTECCPCNAMQALNETFENLASELEKDKTFFDVSVSCIIQQWKLWDNQKRDQFITAIRQLNPSLFSQVFNCQSYADNLSTNAEEK